MAERSSSGKLQSTLPSDRELVLTRVFDAPRRLVFDAWTKPELVRRGGQTGFTSHTLYATAEGRDGHLQSGMEYGANIGMDRLEEVARELLTRELAANASVSPAAGAAGAYS